jgi:hypothetical protein
MCAVVGDQPLHRQVDFSDHHPLAVLVEHGAHAGDDVVYFRPIGIVGGEQLPMRRQMRCIRCVGQVIAKLIVLDDVPDHVDPKPVDAAV